MMKIHNLFVFIILFSFSWNAQSKKAKINYEYRKYEKFDFSEIGVEGEAGSPGDLSIRPGLRKKYGNRLPERPNFNPEIRRSVDAVR